MHGGTPGSAPLGADLRWAYLVSFPCGIRTRGRVTHSRARWLAQLSSSPGFSNAKSGTTAEEFWALLRGALLATTLCAPLIRMHVLCPRSTGKQTRYDLSCVSLQCPAFPWWRGAEKHGYVVQVGVQSGLRAPASRQRGNGLWSSSKTKKSPLLLASFFHPEIQIEIDVSLQQAKLQRPATDARQRR